MNTNCLVGLKTDGFCRILGADGEHIPNLYGAGELIMGNICGGTEIGARYPACGSYLAFVIYGGPITVCTALGIMG